MDEPEWRRSNTPLYLPLIDFWCAGIKRGGVNGFVRKWISYAVAGEFLRYMNDSI